MIYRIIRIWVFICLLAFVAGCKTDNTAVAKKEVVEKVQRRKVPKFSEDSAYDYIAKQVDFGPRYPGTKAHRELINYLSAELNKYTDKVIEQDFKVDFLDEKDVDATNIIGIINPERKKRLLLCAHFDTRKIAEKDEDPEKQDDPILGADDGGSGVGVLLEIARLIKENGIDVGVDIVLFDAEDNGLDGKGWCLGSEYWGKNPHVKNYTAEFGILVDLVGAKNAEFGFEANSAHMAQKYLDKVWNLAERMSYGNYFLKVQAGGVTDDHVNVYKYRKIPTIDIINMSLQNGRTGFDHYHHTHKDNMDIIDKNTLRAVGKVVTATLYNFNNGTF